MIGLYDNSLGSSSPNQLGLPNVEIMKLAEYYKEEKHQFCRLILPHETDMTIYEKIYCCSDFDSAIPMCLRGRDNVEFIGHAFTNEPYVALENDLMDFSIPRTAIYREWLREEQIKGAYTIKQFERFLNSIYYRAYNGKEILPLPPGRKNQRLYLVDKEFFYPGWKENLIQMRNRHPCKIYFLHPIFCKTIEDFFTIHRFNALTHSAEILLDFDFSFDTLDKLLNENQKVLRAEITQSMKIYIPFGAREGVRLTLDALAHELIDRLNILYAFWARGIPIKLQYFAPPLGEYNKWEPLFLAAQTFSAIVKNNCIDKRVKGKVKENYTEFLSRFPKHNLFIQTFKNVSERRLWRYDR